MMSGAPGSMTTGVHTVVLITGSTQLHAAATVIMHTNLT